MRTLKVVPMYTSKGMKDKDERLGEPVAYEVHDVTDPYVTLFPEVIESDGTRRHVWAEGVTFPSEKKAQAWMDEQVRREKQYEK